MDASERIPLPPPAYVTPPVSRSKMYHHSSSFQPDTTYGGYAQTPSVPTSSYRNENQVGNLFPLYKFADIKDKPGMLLVNQNI